MRVLKYFFLKDAYIRLSLNPGFVRSLARPGISVIVRIFADNIKNIVLRLVVN